MLEWGELLEIPTEHHEKSRAESAGDADESNDFDDPIEPEYLVETDVGGRVVFVALAFTIGGIVGFFAHDWALLLLITAVYLVWIAARLVAKLVSVSRSAHWRTPSLFVAPIRQLTTRNAPTTTLLQREGGSAGTALQSLRHTVSDDGIAIRRDSLRVGPDGYRPDCSLYVSVNSGEPDGCFRSVEFLVFE